MCEFRVSKTIEKYTEANVEEEKSGGRGILILGNEIKNLKGAVKDMTIG
ncbi:hypothetical protein [Neobacillus sp. OS1-33]|nr:hypothetical protein [Neobacillus sp. OS1-33]WML23859.1 hypothetical protein RCG22_12750 [Neobacillus sp. OS1-33]